MIKKIFFITILIASTYFLQNLFAAEEHGEHEHEGAMHKHAESAKMKNPVQATAESIEKGQSLYKNICTICHGNEGKGDGPSATALNPKPSNLTDAEWKHGGSDGEIFNVITKGVQGTTMVPYESSISETDRWNLVNYIKSLSKGKSEETKPSSMKSGDQVYYCPMHPDKTSDKPGKCPVCGMDMGLEKK